MNNYMKEDLVEALKEVTSTISKCEKIHGKFAEGTSQHTLLKNRIKAMYISKILILKELSKIEDILEEVEENYTKEEMREALRPIESIISKCEKGQSKFVKGTPHYNRFENIIKSMNVSRNLILEEVSK